MHPHCPTVLLQNTVQHMQAHSPASPFPPRAPHNTSKVVCLLRSDICRVLGSVSSTTASVPMREGHVMTLRNAGHDLRNAGPLRARLGGVISASAIVRTVAPRARLG